MIILSIAKRVLGAIWYLLQWPARLFLRAIHGNLHAIPGLRAWALEVKAGRGVLGN